MKKMFILSFIILLSFISIAKADDKSDADLAKTNADTACNDYYKMYDIAVKGFDDTDAQHSKLNDDLQIKQACMKKEDIDKVKDYLNSSTKIRGYMSTEYDNMLANEASGFIDYQDGVSYYANSQFPTSIFCWNDAKDYFVSAYSNATVIDGHAVSRKTILDMGQSLIP